MSGCSLGFPGDGAWDKGLCACSLFKKRSPEERAWEWETETGRKEGCIIVHYPAGYWVTSGTHRTLPRLCAWWKWGWDSYSLVLWHHCLVALTHPQFHANLLVCKVFRGGIFPKNRRFLLESENTRNFLSQLCVKMEVGWGVWAVLKVLQGFSHLIPTLWNKHYFNLG